MATLGDHAEPWRQFRAARIHQAVRSWADRHGVPFDQIIGPAVPTNHLDLGARPDLAPPVFQASASVHELRRWLHTVIDTLDPADISQILLPAGSLFKLTTRRG
jgi:hypothetical protein